MVFIITVCILIVWGLLGLFELGHYGKDVLGEKGLGLGFLTYLLICGPCGWFVTSWWLIAFIYIRIESSVLTIRTFYVKYLKFKNE